ncbi:MAG: hypothetical protein BGO12_06015 [Verrucomicrobia bacterium 61-8]|nr:MCE family protein [Verrucomicrobiota bacterium]OJU99519.1 MAG: hypothetical protein BGO12_06015 [Verrucomicrobia bacterium 61-8]
MSQTPIDKEDAGEIVSTRRTFPWAWVFPIIAAAATVWLFWNNYREEGPEIDIAFAEAPGIEAGKTPLVFRGVHAGKVTRVHLDPKLNGVIVSVRLRAFASSLARSNTDYWIEKPVVSLQQLTGLEAIIQGNSIRARQRPGNGSYETRFTGLAKAPLSPLDAPTLLIKLRADSIPMVDHGSPIYHLGVPVGWVVEKEIDTDGRPYVQVVIDENHAQMVNDASRFWLIPATSLKAGPGGLSLNIAGLESLIQGGIAFDDFGIKGQPVDDGKEFELQPDEASARASGRKISIAFEDSRGIVADQTRIMYLGQPVGIISKVEIPSGSQTAIATAQLEPSYDFLAAKESQFTLVRPTANLEGIKGLDAIITGPYIECQAGSGEPAETFAGITVGNPAARQNDLLVTLTADSLPTIEPGAPVYYRGLVAGAIKEKTLTANGQPALIASIKPDFQSALVSSSRFWRTPATSAMAGPGVINIHIEGITALLSGGVTFDSFGASGSPVQEGQRYQLFDDEASARATSAPIRIRFASAQGILPGRTELRYLGVRVGLVDEVRTDRGRVEVIARIQPGYENLRREDSIFSLVEPQISLQGISGLETIISGVYIDCIPGSGGYGNVFSGRMITDPSLAEASGFTIKISTPATTVGLGAQVLYRDVKVGDVTTKTLSPDNSRVLLTVVIDPKYRDLVRQNSVFWNASEPEAKIGFLRLKVDAPTLSGIAGRIAFGTPDKPGPPARPGQVFELGKPIRQK